MAVLNLDEFLANLEREVRVATEQDSVTLQRVIATEALTRVVLRTRVDTGRARGNWQLSVGGSPAGETGVLDPNGQSTIQAGLAALAELRPFSDVVVGNNVEYIIYLEALDMMVSMTAAELEAAFGGSAA